MIFKSQGQTMVREAGEPLRVVVNMFLVDVKPNDIEKMAETLAEIEKALGGKFTIVKVQDDNADRQAATNNG